MEKIKNSDTENLCEAAIAASAAAEQEIYLKGLETTIASLSSIIECGTLDPSCIAMYVDMMFKSKEKYVKEKQKAKGKSLYIIEKRTRADGSTYELYKTRVVDTGKYISNRSYEGLIDTLYKYYTDQESDTLESVFEPATMWKAKQGVTGKTVYEYKNTWDNHIACDPISRCRLKDLDYITLLQFYERLCTEKHMTYSQVQNIRNVFSYVMRYCLNNRLITHNPANDVDYKNLPYAKTPSTKGKIKKTPFTQSQTLKIIKMCQEDAAKMGQDVLHSLGIIFAIVMGDRYGELRGLRWENIDFTNSTVTVEEQAVPEYEVLDDLTFQYKGRTRNGHIKGYECPVSLPLPAEVADVLKTIRDMDLDKEDVFPANHFRYNTFNNKVKEYAGRIGLNAKKYTTHSLRATAATNLYLKTHDIYQVQLLLHHTTPEMTMRYIKDLDISEKLRVSMMQSLSCMCSA